jgi:S-(hydroxymethyl)glutathione dehydrogenase/alcohol dehydrogenase
MVPDTRVGMTFGHEFTGIVEEVGSSVQNAEGRRPRAGAVQYLLRLLLLLPEGALQQLPQHQSEATAVGGIYGYSHTTGGYDGGQAELVRVPMADVGPTVIPSTMNPTTTPCC